MTSHREELAPGTLIAQRYRIVQKLGSGGMGAVYEAVQEGLGRRVALKVLFAEYAEQPELIARFQREAQAAASLGHGNIVTVTDFGSDQGVLFLVMERLDGASLSTVIARERALAPQRAAWVAAQVLSALAAAHRAGIVHRDVKPDNVFLTEVSGVRDVVKVLDFGVARFTDGHGNSNLTSTGAVLGTPAYMSPEQARGLSVDARTDVYAVGVLLYEMLSGRQPFQASNYHALLFAILEERPAPLSSLRHDLPPPLVAVVERAMAKDLGTRFQTADELRAALSPWLASPGAVDVYARTGELPQVSAPSVMAAQTGAPFAIAPPPSAAAGPFAPAPPAPAPAPARTPWGIWIALVIFIAVAGGAIVAVRRIVDRASRDARESIDGLRVAGQRLASANGAGSWPGVDPDASAALDHLLDAAAINEAYVRAMQAQLMASVDASAPWVSRATRNPYAPPMPRAVLAWSLQGGQLNGETLEYVRSRLDERTASIQVCANAGSPGMQGGIQASSTLSLDVVLDRQGRVERAVAHDDHARAQFFGVACIAQVLHRLPLSRQRTGGTVTLEFAFRPVS